MSEPKRPDFLIPTRRGRLLAAINEVLTAFPLDVLADGHRSLPRRPIDLYCGDCFGQLSYADIVDHIPNTWSTFATKHHRLVCRRHGNIHISVDAEPTGMGWFGLPVDYEPSYAQVLDFLMPEGEVARLVEQTDGVHRFTTLKVMSTDEGREYYRAELRKLQKEPQ